MIDGSTIVDGITASTKGNFKKKIDQENNIQSGGSVRFLFAREKPDRAARFKTSNKQTPGKRVKHTHTHTLTHTHTNTATHTRTETAIVVVGSAVRYAT